ncbi:MAG TPA: amidase [Candidatus Binataceae bacterium]|nr:amidase [Candidatus Binataceae bacterium]
MANKELLEFDVAALAPKLRAKEISPVELTQAYLDRIEEVEERVLSYITVTADAAREMARKAEAEIAAGRWRGPFHGVPIGLKDLCYTRSILTTGGSKILADFVPGYDCTVWSRLAQAGAVLLGKLNLHEFAYGATSNNPHWGAVHNPYHLDHIPGGSSGGSAAAIVARTAAATIGTDTGGSIRIPAACCGCVGLKQTWGRVSRWGVMPLADTLDHTGPITRSVRDAALMLNVIAGHDPNDATSSCEPVPDYTGRLGGDLKGVRVGVIRELNSGLSDDVARVFGAAQRQLEELGATVEEVSVPALAEGAMVTMVVLMAEALEFHEQWIRERSADYGADVRSLLEISMTITAANYVRAQRERNLMLADTMRALEGRAALLAPTLAATAPRIDDAQYDVISNMVRFTGPFNATGQPVVAIPIGLSRDAMPLSMQIIGRPFDEVTVLQVADAYERARGPLAAPKL